MKFFRMVSPDVYAVAKLHRDAAFVRWHRFASRYSFWPLDVRIRQRLKLREQISIRRESALCALWPLRQRNEMFLIAPASNVNDPRN